MVLFGQEKTEFFGEKGYRETPNGRLISYEYAD
jgi:hypothetical protein